MFTFEKAVGLQKKVVEFYEAGKITGALCHGVAVLRYATGSAGCPCGYAGRWTPIGIT